MTEKDYLIKVLIYRQNEIDSMLEDEDIFLSDPVREAMEEESASISELMERVFAFNSCHIIGNVVINYILGGKEYGICYRSWNRCFTDDCYSCNN